MANCGPNTNDCQFFITNGRHSARWDYPIHTIGALISGSDIQQDIENVPVVNTTVAILPNRRPRW